MGTVMIMAGGTGGHIFPALAVAHELKSRGWEIIWLGAENSMEARLVPQYGFPFETLRIKGVRGNGIKRWLFLPLMLMGAFIQAIMVLFRYRPDIAIGFGGYTGFPGGVASRLLGKPLVIHEQNSVAGLTNRLLSSIASRTLFAFPGVFPNKMGQVGNPVRTELTVLADPNDRFKGRTGPLNVLVVGGSLGAKIFNEIMPEAIAMIPAAQRPHIVHQAGIQHSDRLANAYRESGVNAECLAFIDDMAARYASADLVICRAGALTIAELAAVGIGSVLVPFPHAVDDHQTGNARYLLDAQAAYLIPQPEFSAEKLAQLLTTITREDCAEMARRARCLAVLDAASRVADECEVLTGKNETSN